MKTFTKFLTMLAVAALFATGCVNEEPPYKEDPNPEPAGMTGYLSIGNLSMTVVYDETEIRPDDTSDETQAARTASGTRATAPDVDSFIVEILDADNAQVLEMTYAELKEQLKTPMELKVGVYRMEVRSEDTMPGADWEHPVYGATSDFTITKAQTTSPEEVVCTLQNIKVSVEYSPELADMLADTSKATVSLGDTSLDFSKTETRAAYFKPLALENTLNFAFDGTFADTGVPAKFSKQITGVKAGQWRKVSVVIGYADKGNILFSVKVDNSILQDNKFVVDGTENLGEELLEDPNAPALTWPGHDMTQPFTLTDAMFDAEGNCIEPFAFDLSSPNGIESLQVTVGSTNSQFLASMSAIQLPQTFDLCALDASSAAGIILKGFGYPVGSELKGQTAKSFNIAGQIRALYEFDGTHTFFASCQAGDQKVTLRIEDANGGSSEVATTYRLEGLVPVTADDYDLWANTVTLRVVSFTPGTTVQFGLRSSGGEWQPMAGTSQGNDFITATYAPQWEEKTTADWSTPATVLPYSRLKKGTGISAGNTYDYKATVGSKELSGRFTADEGAPMTDGSLESWRSAQQFPGSGTNYTFWGSGYNPFAKELCTRDEAMPGRVGTYCAKLSATYNTLAKVPAPGNLFTGDFAIQVLGGMGGNVSFGKKFAYNARPRAVRFKYHATIGEVNYNLHGGKIPVGEMDKARIFVCIVDWTAQQKVFAGTKAPTGTWDPETQTEAANGPIIGYASKFIEETTQGDEMVEVILPINYYQDTAAAPDGKYNIVVSCSTSAYGDYMDACTTNVMYVDDFEWVY